MVAVHQGAARYDTQTASQCGHQAAAVAELNTNPSLTLDHGCNCTSGRTAASHALRKVTHISDNTLWEQKARQTQLRMKLRP